MAVGVVCGLLGVFSAAVLHQPLPMLVALIGAFLGVTIGLVLGIGAFVPVYSDIRYASSWRFIVMAMHDVVRGVPQTEDPAS